MTMKGSYNTSPVWSPNGDYIAYVGRIAGHNQIFLLEYSTLLTKQLTKYGDNEHPSFSPDGMFITFDSNRDGIKSVYTMRINGEAQRRITPLSVDTSYPVWSPYF
ncbi:MAG: hypothetical protein D6828_06225 [Nitrospirae bacterium]|nr:MAG: hypothetical protein D6828_06225 [Nitrospirota bacterium]